VRRIAPLLALLLLGGCVYYNGMYNARKFTSDAEKAEREGRTIDAATAWGQVTVKAETLLVRHPDTRYAPEARVLMGRAYAKLGDCVQARSSLESSLHALSDTALRAQGELTLARCLVKLGEPKSAAEHFRSLYTASADSARRALLPELVAALGAAGEYQEALDLAGSAPEALGHQRLLLLAGAGHVAEAAALADSLAALGDTLAPWDSAATLAGTRSPAAGSRIVDAMLRLPDMPGQRRALLLLNDADRLAPVNSAGAMARYREVLALGSPASTMARARLKMARLRLAHVTDLAELDSVAVALERENVEGSPVAFDAAALANAVHVLIAVRDSVTAETPQGDMRMFLAGELAGDSLHAPALAHQLLVRTADLWPASPYAAKALLAARLIAPADSLLRLRIESAYGANPYVRMVRGEDAPELRALEDSLGAFASAQFSRGLAPPGTRATPTPAPSRPGQRPAPRRPAPGQQLPEPR